MFISWANLLKALTFPIALREACSTCAKTHFNHMFTLMINYSCIRSKSVAADFTWMCSLLFAEDVQFICLHWFMFKREQRDNEKVAQPPADVIKNTNAVSTYVSFVICSFFKPHRLQITECPCPRSRAKPFIRIPVGFVHKRPSADVAFWIKSCPTIWLHQR